MPCAASPTTALLVLDVQPAIVARFPGPYLERVRAAIRAARTGGIAVVFVRVAFREGHPEVSDRNKIFGRYRGGTALLDGDEDGRLHPSLDVADDDIVVTKRRVSAFSGSDLDVVLRAMRVEHLVLCGVATSGVVLSTLREAADRDFWLTVLSDACGDRDDEVQRVLCEKVFPAQATVIEVAPWAASL